MIEKLMKKEVEMPTIVEVYDSMHRVFGYFDERFDQIDRRFESVDEHFEAIEGRLSTIEHDMKDVKVTLVDLQENFQALSIAFDHDAEVLVDHEERLKNLENGTSKVA